METDFYVSVEQWQYCPLSIQLNAIPHRPKTDADGLSAKTPLKNKSPVFFQMHDHDQNDYFSLMFSIDLIASQWFILAHIPVYLLCVLALHFNHLINLWNTE